ncbi:hypothetical protein ACF3NS_02410 [Arsenicicoccus cauae]|uniref:hypothetical protein n=1 Tax=Arsenicicoccus cauae TaxID=2663847 RepID=UPI00259541B8|nr:hypothetical protein [uncultured Arsenicicoccus sp.]
MTPPSDDERRRRELRARERSRRGHPVGRELPGAAVPPVVARLGEVLATGTPLDALLEVSALLHEVGGGSAELDTRWLVSALVEHDDAVTTTALAVLSRLLGDDVLRARVKREMRLREDPVPGWAADLDSLVRLAGRTDQTVLIELAEPLALRPMAHLHARLDPADGGVLDGRVVPSGPLSSWPGCGPLVRWAVRVAPTAAPT